MLGDQCGPTRQRRSGTARHVNHGIGLFSIGLSPDDYNRELERARIRRRPVPQNGHGAALQSRREVRWQARQVARRGLKERGAGCLSFGVAWYSDDAKDRAKEHATFEHLEGPLAKELGPLSVSG